MNTDLLYAIITIATCIAFLLAMRFSTKVIAAAMVVAWLLFGLLAWMCFTAFITLSAVVDIVLRIKRLLKRKKEKDFEGLRYEEILGI